MKYNFETPEDELEVVRSLDLSFLQAQMTDNNLEGIQHNDENAEIADMLTDLLLKEGFSMSLDYDLWRTDIETFLTNIYKNTSPEDLNQKKYQGIVNLVEGHYLAQFEDYVIRNAETAFKNGLKDKSEILEKDSIIRFDEDSSAVIAVGTTTARDIVRMKQYMTEVSPEFDALITVMADFQSLRTERKNNEVKQTKAYRQATNSPTK